VLGLPPAITAATAFDALSHALETIWNRNATPLTDRIAIESAAYILKWMETAFDSSLSGAVEGRAEMLEGACMAGTAFTMTGTAAVHALSFVLSEEWHIPHGVACAFTLDDIFRMNISDIKTRQRLEQVTQALFGTDDVEILLNRIIALKKKFGLPFTFEDLNINLEENRIAQLFDKTLDDPKMKNNIIPVDSKKVFELMKKKIAGSD
jgi:alcohol dehydrogenase class IV